MNEQGKKDSSHDEKIVIHQNTISIPSSPSSSSPSTQNLNNTEKKKSPASFLSFSSSSSKASSHNRAVSTGSIGSSSMFSRFTLPSSSLFSSAPETIIIKRVKEYITTIDKYIKVRKERVEKEKKTLEESDDVNFKISKEEKSLTMNKIIERQKLKVKMNLHNMYIDILQSKKKEIQQLFYFIEQGSNNEPISESDQKRRIRSWLHLDGEKGKENNHEKIVNNWLKPLGEKEDSLSNDILNAEASADMRKRIHTSTRAYKACNKLLKEMRGESNNKQLQPNPVYGGAVLTSNIPDRMMDGDESNINQTIDAKSTESKEDKKERFCVTLKELIKMYHFTETDKNLPYETRQKILRKFLHKFDHLLYQNVTLYKKWIDEMKSIRDGKNAEKYFIVDREREPESIKSEENMKLQTQYMQEKLQGSDKVSSKDSTIGLDPSKTYHSNDSLSGVTRYFYIYIGYEYIVDSGYNMNDDNSVEDFDSNHGMVSAGESKLTEFLAKSLKRDEDLNDNGKGEGLTVEEEEEDKEHRQPLAIFTRMMKNVIFSSLHEYFFGYLDDGLQMVRRNQEWREMLAEVRKIPAADIGVATEYLPLVDFVSNVKKQIEEANEEDKEVFNNNIKPDRESNQEEKKLAKFASMSDISMTVFCGDETINNLTNYEEREAYERGLAKLGDNQSTEAMNFPVQDINDDQSRSTKDDDTNFDIKNLEGIKNAYYKTSAMFSRLSMAMNTDEMTRIITEAMKQLHVDAAEVSGQNNPKRKSKPLDADTMFPIVLYCIIHADLPDMPSVLHVLFTFLLGQDSAFNGEVAYYATTVNAAVQQIFPLLHGYRQKLKSNENEKNSTDGEPRVIQDGKEVASIKDNNDEKIPSEVKEEEVKIEQNTISIENNSVTKDESLLTSNEDVIDLKKVSDSNLTRNVNKKSESDSGIIGKFEKNEIDDEKPEKDFTDDTSEGRSSTASRAPSENLYDSDYGQQIEFLKALEEYGYLPMKDYGNESEAELEATEKRHAEGWLHLHQWLNKHEDMIRGLAVLQEEGFIMD